MKIMSPEKKWIKSWPRGKKKTRIPLKNKVATAHWAAHSLKFENDADETSRTAGRQRHSHSMLAGGLVVTSKTTRLAWGTSLTMREETRAMRS